MYRTRKLFQRFIMLNHEDYKKNYYSQFGEDGIIDRKLVIIKEI